MPTPNSKGSDNASKSPEKASTGQSTKSTSTRGKGGRNSKTPKK